MKKAISVILFIIVARLCDGQIVVPTQTTTTIIPSGLIVRGSANIMYSPCFIKYTDTTYTTVQWRWNPTYVGPLADTMKVSPKRVLQAMVIDEGLPWSSGYLDTLITKYKIQP